MGKQKDLPWDDADDSMMRVGKACYYSHPPLKIGKYRVYGGNCGNPVHLDCHVYVALQSGSRVKLPYPWEPGAGEVTQVEFTITDGHAPSNVSEFKLMIDWLCNQLRAGLKVHVGCIGGHGRTGMVLAAMVAKMLPDEQDPIGYVRTNYCQKAVETHSQVGFLVKHYGAKQVNPSKPSKSTAFAVAKGREFKPTGAYEFPSSNKSSGYQPSSVTKFADTQRTVEPVKSRRNIFEPAQ